MWKRYTSAGALATLVGGTIMIGLSMQMPELIAPFDHGVEPGGEGAKAYKYMRALFGIIACTGLGVIVSLVTKPKPPESLDNLVVGQITKPHT